MVSISIELTDDEVARLKERAAALALAPEQLAAAVLRDELNAHDEDFERLARRIIDKNSELYARLA